MRTEDEKRAYAKGYNAGRRNDWPAHRPPVPPEPVLAALVKALSDLRDGVDGACATLDESDELTAQLSPLVDAANDALVGLTEWASGSKAE